MNNIYREHKVLFWERTSEVSTSHKLIGEEPLSIRIQGHPYSVMMRTPGDEIALAAGFCLSEGIIDQPDDIAAIACCEDADADKNTVTVTLNKSRLEKIPQYLERRGFISQTGCGLCGKQIVEELYQTVHPIEDGKKADVRSALRCIDELSRHQPLREHTNAAHAAAIFNADYAMISIAEDVGRHNALDKAVGKLFLEGKLGEASLLVMSSRISYEIVQKAARARIPVIFAISRPTALAVELASQLNMSLACLAKGSGLYIYCCHQRILGISTMQGGQ
jgi:FdhD protein